MGLQWWGSSLSASSPPLAILIYFICTRTLWPASLCQRLEALVIGTLFMLLPQTLESLNSMSLSVSCPQGKLFQAVFSSASCRWTIHSQPGNALPFILGSIFSVAKDRARQGTDRLHHHGLIPASWHSTFPSKQQSCLTHSSQEASHGP
jgi:hypothetical protein